MDTNQEDDPRGVIADAYGIQGISADECRSIFLDWALEPRDIAEARLAAARLLDVFSPKNPDHPMNRILEETLIEISTPPKRRGGRSAR